jgi:hypothetical protein
MECLVLRMKGTKQPPQQRHDAHQQLRIKVKQEQQQRQHPTLSLYSARLLEALWEVKGVDRPLACAWMLRPTPSKAAGERAPFAPQADHRPFLLTVRGSWQGPISTQGPCCACFARPRQFGN